MRLRIVHLVVLCTILVLCCAWTKEDHEIFRLRDEIEVSEGRDVTFYDVLGVSPSATYDDIEKAFKKKSKTLHPDKAKHSFIASRSTGKPKSKSRRSGEKKGVHVSQGPSQSEIQAFVKQATARYRRLTLVTNILKGESRDHYDHFLKNGFPKWRGTGYYYNRYRPGLGSVLVGLFIVVGGFAHYGALVLGWKQQRAFADRMIRQARKAAWGDETGIRGIPGLNGPTPFANPTAIEGKDTMANLNRRQKREMERQNKKEGRSGKGGQTMKSAESSIVSPSGEKKRVVAENGKVLVVDSIGNVFLEEEDEDGQVAESYLDVDEIPRPTLRDTAVYRFPIWLYRKAADPFLKSTTPIPSHLSQKQSQTAEKKMEIAIQQPGESSQESADGFEIIEAGGTEDIDERKKKSKKARK